jgi:hypothetical protein
MRGGTGGTGKGTPDSTTSMVVSFNRNQPPLAAARSRAAAIRR